VFKNKSELLRNQISRAVFVKTYTARSANKEPSWSDTLSLPHIHSTPVAIPKRKQTGSTPWRSLSTC